MADLGYPTSKTRRGRVIDMGDTCPTVTAEDFNVRRVESRYRIRKLSEHECFRLMNFKDEDFEKARAVNSATQCYKQAGNSIVRAVLMAIFSQMNISGVTPWNDMSDDERYELIYKDTGLKP